MHVILKIFITLLLFYFPRLARADLIAPEEYYSGNEIFSNVFIVFLGLVIINLLFELPVILKIIKPLKTKFNKLLLVSFFSNFISYVIVVFGLILALDTVGPLSSLLITEPLAVIIEFSILYHFFKKAFTDIPKSTFFKAVLLANLTSLTIGSLIFWLFLNTFI